MKKTDSVVFVISSSNRRRPGSIAERLSPIFISDKGNIVLVSRVIESSFFWLILSRILELFLKINNGFRIYFYSKYNSRFLDIFIFSYFAIFYMKLHKKSNADRNLIHLVEPSIYITRFALKAKIKVIYEQNTSVEDYFENLKSKGTLYNNLSKNNIVHKHQEWSIKNADAVIVPSRFVLKQILNYRTNNIYIVPYYLPKQTVSKISKIDEKIKIAFVGNWTLNKGSQMYIDVASHFMGSEDVEFTAYGRVYSNSISTDVIQHMGFSSRDDIYKNIDVLFLPSWGEGSARVAYEAVSNGILFVGSVECGIPFQLGSPWIKKHNDKDGFIEYLGSLNLSKLKNHVVLQREQLKTYTESQYRKNVHSVYKDHILF